MTAPTVQPLRSGRAVLEDVDGLKEFDSWADAVADCRRRGVLPVVLPFPSRTPGVPFEVLAVAPPRPVLT